MAPVFIPGLQLSEQFYQQAVLPLLHQAIPRLSHSAGLLDAGSEVFGFDTPRSTDHHWGPRVLIFLSDNDYQQYAKRLNDDLAQHLPYEFMGYSTHFSEPDDFGVQLLEPIHSGPVRHRVAITTVASFCRKWLAGYDPQTDASLHDWKRWPMQSLFAIRKGCLFHDDLHLESLRQRLWFYPRDVMLYLLSSPVRLPALAMPRPAVYLIGDAPVRTMGLSGIMDALLHQRFDRRLQSMLTWWANRDCKRIRPWCPLCPTRLV